MRSSARPADNPKRTRRTVRLRRVPVLTAVVHCGIYCDSHRRTCVRVRMPRALGHVTRLFSSLRQRGCVDLLACSHGLCLGSHCRNCMLCIGRRRSLPHSGATVVTVITGAHRVVRAPAGASYASPTLSLPPSLSRARSTNNECAATTEMADAKGADAAMADVPLYFDPHHFHRSTVLDPSLTDLCSCFQIHAI